MRFDNCQKISAFDIINKFSEKEIAYDIYLWRGKTITKNCKKDCPATANGYNFRFSRSNTKITPQRTEINQSLVFSSN